MKISIEKPRENNWKFPCLGIHNTTSKIVAFMDYKKGVIVEEGNGALLLGHYREDWEIDNFTPYTPIETKQQSIDWDKVELPIICNNKYKEFCIIDRIGASKVEGYIVYHSGILGTLEGVFNNTEKRNEYLNSLEIIPKGTITTIEL
jgi:hypothetical protein